MTLSVEHPSLLYRLAGAFLPLRARGMLLDGTAHPPPTFGARARRVPLPAPSVDLHEAQLALFVSRLGQLLGADDERSRQRLERDVLELAVPLQAGGLFEVMRIAHPPLAAMVSDHLAGQV
ncbi:hypothetical protein [Dyella sp. A6]|uniref:hypothetical protein n=1 Tax=Dyella aluminiiresistens TaxID=3069105 RepID=UPI002E7767BC|nr:hypothetical protein [Dyella sp. A6]